jgi:hypothetical protein
MICKERILLLQCSLNTFVLIFKIKPLYFISGCWCIVLKCSNIEVSVSVWSGLRNVVQYRTSDVQIVFSAFFSLAFYINPVLNKLKGLNRHLKSLCFSKKQYLLIVKTVIVYSMLSFNN